MAVRAGSADFFIAELNAEAALARPSQRSAAPTPSDVLDALWRPLLLTWPDREAEGLVKVPHRRLLTLDERRPMPPSTPCPVSNDERARLMLEIAEGKSFSYADRAWPARRGQGALCITPFQRCVL